MKYIYYSSLYKKYVIGKIVKFHRMYQGGMQFTIKYKNETKIISASIDIWNEIKREKSLDSNKDVVLLWFKGEIPTVKDKNSDRFDVVCKRYIYMYCPEELL